jgi:NADH:ubiquinone oxidoreductase subunit 6 (subunit J)
MHALFFWLFSIGMIICALAVVFNRNAVASALCFTFTIVFMAGLFVMLSAFFLAAVQILVTAGAVMVLFLFIIMLLDLTAMEHAPRHWTWMACSGVLALAFLGLVARTLGTMPPPQPTDAQVRMTAPDFVIKAAVSAGGKTVNAEMSQSDVDKFDDTHQIGRLLFATKPGPRQNPRGFTSYVAPFEITSLLILVATIGVIVLCKEDERPRPHRREDITREAPPVREQEPALKS